MFVPDRKAYGTRAPEMVAFKFIKAKLKIERFKEQLPHLQSFNKTHYIARLDCGHHVMRRKASLVTTICPRCYEMWKDDRYKYSDFLKNKKEYFTWKDDALRNINECNISE
jgi:hypothetical protein